MNNLAKELGFHFSYSNRLNGCMDFGIWIAAGLKCTMYIRMAAQDKPRVGIENLSASASFI